MANFPPNGPYGGPFNYHGQFAPPPPHPPPPPNVPYNMMQPPPYLQQRAPMYNPPPQNGLVQYANTAAFHNNMQYPPQPGLQHNMSIPPPPSVPQIFGYGQFRNNGPPQPFAPLPQAHIYHPQGTGLVNHVSSPAHVIPLTTTQQKPSSPFVSSAKADTDMGYLLAGANSGKEEGELSERDFERPRAEANLPLKISSRQDSPEAGELTVEPNHDDSNLRSLSSSVLGHHSTENVAVNSEMQDMAHQLDEESTGSTNDTATAGTMLKEAQDSPYPSNETKMAMQDSYSIPFTSQNDTVMMEAPTIKPVTEKPEPLEHERDAHNKRSEKKGLAKQALRQLHSSNINHEQLLAEGIDLAVLQELYAEIGVNLPDQPQTGFDVSRLEVDSNGSKNTSSRPEPIASSLKLQSQIDSIDISPKPADMLGKSITQSDDHNQKPSETSLTEKNSMSVTAVAQAETEASANTKQQKQIAQMPPKKPTLNSTPNKALDRKDYIAKLLAAKEAVKHTPNTAKTPKAPEPRPEQASPPVSTSLSEPMSTSISILNSESTLAPPSDFNPGALQLLSPRAKTRSDVESRPDPKIELEQNHSTTQSADDRETQTETRQAIENKRPDFKDPVQTELVRKRLEALKKNTQLQQPLPTKPTGQEYTQASTAHVKTRNLGQSGPQEERATVDSTMTNGPSTQPQNSETSLTNTQHYSPARPFFASGDRRSFSGLPGLSFVPPAPQLPSPVLSTSAKPTADTRESLREVSILSETSSGEIIEPHVSEDKDLSVNLPATSQISGTQQPAVPVTSSVTTLETRKRATAADFIDSPPERVKRRSGSNGRIQLVIEVSDEEDFDEPDIDSANQPAENALPTLTRQPIERNSIGGKTFRDFPPLSNFPSRPAASSVTSTPPKAQTPKDLAQAEEQIRLVKQKIAELEQRKKSKNIISDNQTPAASSRAESLPAASKSIEDRQKALESVSQELEARQNSLATATSAMQETLEFEKRTQALVAEKAEQERKQAARATTVTERRSRLERKATLEATLPKLDSQIEAARARLDEMRKQQEEIESEIQRGNEGRAALIDELNVLLSSLEPEAGDDSTPTGDQGERYPSNPMDSCQVTVADDTNNSRANESERHKSNSPSDHSDTKQVIITPADSVIDRQRPMHPDMLGDNMDISSSSGDEGQILSSRPSVTPGPVPDKDIEPPDDDNQEPSPNEEVQSQDEYEPENFSPEPSPYPGQEKPDWDAQVEMAIDSYDEYEPSLGGDVSPAQRPISILSDSDESVESFVPPTDFGPSHQGNVEHSQSDDTSEMYRPPSSSPQEEGEVFEGLRSDPDDYEPPEPALSVDNDVAALEHDRSPNHGSLPEDLDIMEVEADSGAPTETIQNVLEDPDLKGDHDSLPNNDVKFGHYTPYESPLTQFASYRFHPQYVSEVPGGFRSLTYSHQIDPHKPLCRWELAGGICNDSSCDYQHFRQLPLTDNTLLLQLGSVHEGTTREEKQNYISGLKKTISGMRDRKLEDVSAMASEIVAYRANFLGDTSRILTNI